MVRSGSHLVCVCFTKNLTVVVALSILNLLETSSACSLKKLFSITIEMF